MKLPHLIHRWQVVRDNVFFVYERCRVCGERRIREAVPCGSYTSVDWQWIETGEWQEPDTSPWKASTDA